MNELASPNYISLAKILENGNVDELKQELKQNKFLPTVLLPLGNMLHHASLNPNSQVLIFISEKFSNIDVNFKNVKGHTPLDLAISRGNLANIYILIDRKGIYDEDIHTQLKFQRKYDLLEKILNRKNQKSNESFNNNQNLEVKSIDSLKQKESKINLFSYFSTSKLINRQGYVAINNQPESKLKVL